MKVRNFMQLSALLCVWHLLQRAFAFTLDVATECSALKIAGHMAIWLCAFLIFGMVWASTSF
jgi:hypothetical protein